MSTASAIALPAPARLAPLPASAWRTATVRQCLLALAWTLGLSGFFALWLVVERWGLGLPKNGRLVRSPALVPMVIIGVPHILIGFLFLATSRRVRTPGGPLRLAGFVALGAALCWAFWAAGATQAADKIPAAAVALYFVVHQLRDEAFFYAAHRDAPSDVSPERTQRFLAVTTWILVVSLAGLGIWLYDLYADRKARLGPLDYVPLGAFGEWALTPWGRGGLVGSVVALLVGARWWAWSRAERTGLWSTLRRHAPMAVIYGLFLAVALGGALAGSVLEAIVLWHVLEWFVFGARQAARQEARVAAGAPPPAPPGPMGWLARAKGTRRGFLALHLGLSAVVFVLMAVWAYAHHRSAASPLWVVASGEAFFYWTIFHVTVSFFPRGAPAPATA